MNSRVMIERLPDIECACATVRRAARLVTQLYDEELEGRLEVGGRSDSHKPSQQVLNKGGNAL